jgi:protein-S-isoprenylcysteine O-methyltransferase Ste14
MTLRKTRVPMTRSKTSRGWLIASYAGLTGFFALELVVREPGEPSSLAAPGSDRGTAELIGAAYAGAAGLVPVLRRRPIGRLPAMAGPVGITMMISGLALRGWSMRVLGRHYSRALRTAAGQTVVTSGPYRVIRHPGYLGSILVWTGFGMVSGSGPAAAATAALLSIAYGRRMAAEERMLTARFGGAYADYAKRTQRLIPFVC